MAPERDEPFKPRCLSVDLEVGKEDGRIHAFGAVRGDTGHGDHGDGSAAQMTRLDALADSVSLPERRDPVVRRAILGSYIRK